MVRPNDTSKVMYLHGRKKVEIITRFRQGNDYGGLSASPRDATHGIEVPDELSQRGELADVEPSAR